MATRTPTEARLRWPRTWSEETDAVGESEKKRQRGMLLNPLRSSVFYDERRASHSFKSAPRRWQEWAVEARAGAVAEPAPGAPAAGTHAGGSPRLFLGSAADWRRPESSRDRQLCSHWGRKQWGARLLFPQATPFFPSSSSSSPSWPPTAASSCSGSSPPSSCT